MDDRVERQPADILAVPSPSRYAAKAWRTRGPGSQRAGRSRRRCVRDESSSSGRTRTTSTLQVGIPAIVLSASGPGSQRGSSSSAFLASYSSGVIAPRSRRSARPASVCGDLVGGRSGAACAGAAPASPPAPPRRPRRAAPVATRRHPGRDRAERRARHRATRPASSRSCFASSICLLEVVGVVEHPVLVDGRLRRGQDRRGRRSRASARRCSGRGSRR